MKATVSSHFIIQPLLRSPGVYHHLIFMLLLSFSALSSSFQSPKKLVGGGVNRIFLRRSKSWRKTAEEVVRSSSLLNLNKRFTSTTTTTMRGSLSSTMDNPEFNNQWSKEESPKVAIIGAGAAGLVTAQILSLNGFKPQIFEKESDQSKTSSSSSSGKKKKSGIGGVWSYQPNSKTKPMYKNLRTNLPRELMAYRSKKWGGDGTSMSFVTHGDVQDYLHEYMVENDLEQFISFDCNIKQLTVLKNHDDDDDDDYRNVSSRRIGHYPRVELEWDSSSSSIQKQTFDAVCICNGHYAAPSSPPIQGIDENYKGEILHSIEYDEPQRFTKKNVLCIGGRASGSDLAREISHYANKVYLSDSSCPINNNNNINNNSEHNDHGSGNAIVSDNVFWVPKTLSIDEKGSIHFEKPCTECPNDIDVIIFCSGYDYQFPFINDQSNLNLSVVSGERRVSPLYEQLWHAQYPNIAFVGLQHSVVPFPFFEFQAEAIVRQWNLIMKDDGGNNHDEKKEQDESVLLKIPKSVEERMESAIRDANSGGPKENGRVQDTHFLGSYQWDACRTYARYAGVLDEDVENHIATNQVSFKNCEVNL